MIIPSIYGAWSIFKNGIQEYVSRIETGGTVLLCTSLIPRRSFGIKETFWRKLGNVPYYKVVRLCHFSLFMTIKKRLGSKIFRTNTFRFSSILKEIIMIMKRSTFDARGSSLEKIFILECSSFTRHQFVYEGLKCSYFLLRPRSFEVKIGIRTNSRMDGNSRSAYKLLNNVKTLHYRSVYFANCNLGLLK